MKKRSFRSSLWSDGSNAAATPGAPPRNFNWLDVGLDARPVGSADRLDLIADIHQ
jgi:hypothetical protein